MRRIFRFKRSARGRKAVLTICLFVQEAGSKKKTGSDFPETSYSLKQLADPRLQQAGVSRGDRHLFAAPEPPHLLPAGKDDPCPMHKYSLPPGAAESTDLCTKMPSLLGVCSCYALVSVLWCRSSKAWSGHQNESFTRKRGGILLSLSSQKVIVGN